MTQEAFTATPLQLVAGTGPYTVVHGYDEGALVVAVIDGVLRTILHPDDYIVDPAASSTGGTVTLAALAATTHAGKQLEITRRTFAIEQGFAGQTARERGLEGQLDWIVRAVQDVLLLAQTIAETDVNAGDVQLAAERATAAVAAATQAVADAQAAQAAVDDLLDGVTPAGTALLGAVSPAAQRVLLGLGDMAEFDAVDFFKDQAVWNAGLDTGQATISAAQLKTTIQTTGLQLGVGQVWQNVAGSRIINTTYQNTTGKPIVWHSYASQGNANNDYQVSSDGLTWIDMGRAGQAGGYQTAMTLVIPPGWYYRLSRVFQLWVELR